MANQTEQPSPKIMTPTQSQADRLVAFLSDWNEDSVQTSMMIMAKADENEKETETELQIQSHSRRSPSPPPHPPTDPLAPDIPLPSGTLRRRNSDSFRNNFAAATANDDDEREDSTANGDGNGGDRAMGSFVTATDSLLPPPPPFIPHEERHIDQNGYLYLHHETTSTSNMSPSCARTALHRPSATARSWARGSGIPPPQPPFSSLVNSRSMPTVTATADHQVDVDTVETETPTPSTSTSTSNQAE